MYQPTRFTCPMRSTLVSALGLVLVPKPSSLTSFLITSSACESSDFGWRTLMWYWFWKQLYKIYLPGKLIFRDYIEENRTSIDLFSYQFFGKTYFYTIHPWKVLPLFFLIGLKAFLLFWISLLMLGLTVMGGMFSMVIWDDATVTTTESGIISRTSSWKKFYEQLQWPFYNHQVVCICNIRISCVTL